MLARIVSLAAASLIAGTAYAAPEAYTLDSRHTFPSFEVNHLGFSTQRGRFNKTTGRITLDRAAKKASAEITIDANSIDTGLAELEDHMRKPDFLDTNKHPNITFKSSNAKFEGETLKALDGELTMRGQTKPLTLVVQRFNCGTHPMNKKTVCGADAVATIKRSDYGMTYALPLVGDEVKVFLQVEAVKD